MRAILLAGGKGTRLKPYTTTLPKPLVPIGDEMPILEIVIRQLARDGFTHITIAVNHMANFIRAFFGDGSAWNIRIDYSMEEKPLSTIGPLTLIGDLPENFLVMNGDILCDLNYKNFYDYHLKKKNEVSVSVYSRDAKIDFGVMKFDENKMVNGFIEKPVYHFDVSMGIYCMNSSVIQSLKRGETYGFDNLMIDGIIKKQKIEAVPHGGLWLDIGRPDDYDFANENFASLKKQLGI